MRLTISPPPLRVRSTIAPSLSFAMKRRSRGAVDGRHRQDGDHVVAVAAEHHRPNVLDAHARLAREEELEASAVEDARHADDVALRRADDALVLVDHRVERVAR
jgi:hypothetical protein